MQNIDKLGTRIKIIRLNSGYKQKELADKLNITASLLSMYEQGKREPSVSFLKTFCDYFHISLSQFFIFVENVDQSVNKAKDQENDLNSVMMELNKLIAHMEKANLSNLQKNA